MQPSATITCEFKFESSHRLRREEWSDAENAAAFGECAQLHGHSYRLLVALRGPVRRETGMVMSFQELMDLVKERVIRQLDHRHLEDVVGGITTTENLLYWIAGQLLPELGTLLHRLELWETRTSSAALTEEDLEALRSAFPPRIMA